MTTHSEVIKSAFHSSLCTALLFVMKRYNSMLLITDNFRHFKGPLLVMKPKSKAEPSPRLFIS